MCGVEAVGNVKSKNKAIANFAANQHVAAQNRAIAYEQKKMELVQSGMPEAKAIKVAEQFIKDNLGTAANAGAQTNNKSNAVVGTSRQERERTEGQTTMSGQVQTNTNIQTGEEANADNNNDNLTGGDSSDTSEIAKLAKEAKATFDNVFSFNPAINRIAKRLESLGVTLTSNVREALENILDNDPKEFKQLSQKLQTMNRDDVKNELNNLSN